jgi:hypothetical protein
MPDDLHHLSVALGEVGMSERKAIPATAAEHVLEAGLEWAGHTRSEVCPCRPYAAVPIAGVETSMTTWVHRRFPEPRNAA